MDERGEIDNRITQGRKFIELMSSMSVLIRLLTGGMVLAMYALVPMGLAFAVLAVIRQLYIIAPVGIGFAVLGPVLARRYIDIGWRWRVRDGNRLPFEAENTFLNVNISSFLPLTSPNKLWHKLSHSARRRFLARCFQFALFIAFVAWAGSSSGAVIALIFSFLAVLVFVWFYAWVGSYVREHGQGSDPWS